MSKHYNWVPACGGKETPFKGRDGKTYLGSWSWRTSDPPSPGCEAQREQRARGTISGQSVRSFWFASEPLGPVVPAKQSSSTLAPATPPGSPLSSVKTAAPE